MLHQSNAVMNDFRKYKLSSDYSTVKTLQKTYIIRKKKMRENTNEETVQQTTESETQMQTE